MNIPVKTEVAACPGVLPEHLARWPWTDWYLAPHIEKEPHCNWKTARDAFMEAYHTPVVHPGLTQAETLSIFQESRIRACHEPLDRSLSR